MHPFGVIAFVLTAAEVFALIRFTRLRKEGEPEHAMLPVMTLLCVLFGLLCLRFSHILSDWKSPMDRGARMRPAPAPVVRFIGWLLLSIPAVTWLILEGKSGG